MDAVDREKQIAQAEEILGDQSEEIGYAKGLFFGQHLQPALLPYPDRLADLQTTELVDKLRDYCKTDIDADAIDRDKKIPDSVVAGLGQLGILGACLPVACGGLNFSQSSYCQILEVLGAHCGSTALFVNAHHSIGPRALVLFGTEEQKARWLPDLASGKSISAFALTEPEAGSDAANVQTTATPTTGGFKLNGEKRWITNGGIAQVLTVMARTPAPGGDSKISAFIVTPDMPGFEVVEERMDKCGVRGTATSRLAFNDMFVPQENLLGQLGKGLRVALTVLDFGRTTFGASCTGSAKYCIERAVAHANERVQFEQTLGSFEMVKEKLAYMQAGAYAMEACTYQTAALIDSGEGDFMLETAMLKVFSTEVLWRIINDTFQIHGGVAYFTDQPFERMMRDARINMIGEGANDVLRAFSALVGMRDVGLELEGVANAIKSPFGNLHKISNFATRRIGQFFVPPAINVRHGELEKEADRLSRDIRSLGGQVERLLATYQKEILEEQHKLGRIADVATELYVSACVLNRLDHELSSALNDQQRSLALASGKYYLQTAHRRIRQNFKALWNNDDAQTNDLANRMLKS